MNSTVQEVNRPQLHPERFPPGHLRTIIKTMLEMVVLAYLLEEPRTGRELIEDIRGDTGVRLSPGRVYPLLRALERRGMLTSQRGARQVIYRPANRQRAEEHVCQSFDGCATIIKFFNDLCRPKRP